MLATVNIIALSSLLILSLIVLTVLFKSKKKEVKKQSEIKLEDLSALLWAKGKKEGHISIEALAPIWKEVGPQQRTKEEEITFENKEITDFFREHIEKATWFRKAQKQREVCTEILKILEKEGGCPSVVNVNDDVEASWDSNTFTILGQVTLLEHTLNVAKEAIQLLVKTDAKHVIPDTVVAALGHDLGKIKSIQSHLYSLGEHPIAAGRVLAEIALFKKLPKKDEISKAIKLHHKRPDGLLGKTLKKADQLARQKELEYVVELSIDKGKKENSIVQPAPSSSDSLFNKNLSKNVCVVPTSTKLVQGAGAVWKAQADIFDEDTEPKQKKPKETINQMDISSWFDAQEFLNEIKVYINRITGRRFMAFSMSDGYVFVQAKAIEEVARKMAERNGAMDIATMAADDLTMRRVLFTVVTHLRVNHDVIAREFIKDQYFGGYFNITMKGGKKMKGFYTPFHAESFGSICEMENQKTGILKNFRKVEPFSE